MEEWIKFQQNMNATTLDLKMQIGQLANSISQIQSIESRNLPSQTIPNPKGGNVSNVTLKSGKELRVASRPKPNPTDTESEPDAGSQVQHQARTAPLSFPSRSLSTTKLETDEDFLKIDPRIFSVPCTIDNCTFVDAMLDLGASINVMPTSVYKSLNFGDLEPTSVVIQLANRSVVQPMGILEDVLVQVNKLIFPTDFYVLDMEDETSKKESKF
ncbi:hypothetical protein CR513_15301, partial [Mucuna pruriens]